MSSTLLRTRLSSGSIASARKTTAPTKALCAGLKARAEIDRRSPGGRSQLAVDPYKGRAGRRVRALLPLRRQPQFRCGRRVQRESYAKKTGVSTRRFLGVLLVRR
jgi:hypothetical protein